MSLVIKETDKINSPILPTIRKNRKTKQVFGARPEEKMGKTKKRMGTIYTGDKKR